MSRLCFLPAFGVALFTFVVASASPPDDARVNDLISVQVAMARARSLLSESQTRKAVDLLEEQLPKINNNPQYLGLLRDAYRAYIRDLQLAGQPDLAKRYLDRLCILDP